jgi:putative membrane protein
MLSQLSTDEAKAKVAEVWAFHPHVEVWLLVVGLVGAYVYMARVIGPVAVTSGRAITRRQLTCFVLAMLMFWLASDWPLHDLAENYLYSAHMLQHMMLSYFLAPLALLATPEWMARAIFGSGRAYRALRFLTRPVVAGVAFNTVVMVTHIPGVVNNSVQSAPLHYGLHMLLVLTSLLMFMPVCGPLPELHLAPAPKMIYLFLQSVVPTVPAAWLTFAENTVYSAYDKPVRVWGITVAADQQMAGAIMKLGGSIYLWTIIGVIFFRHFVIGTGREMRLRRVDEPVPVGFVGSELTFADVQEAFERSPAPTEATPR